MQPEFEKYIEQTVEAYSATVLRIAFQNVKNHASAEDVTQEVFLRLMAQPMFADPAHLRAWLIRVTVNYCRDLLRSGWFRKTEPLEDYRESIPFEPEERELLDELRRMPANYRNTLYLYFYEGYTVPEIAQVLGKKTNTVSSWLTRGKRLLRDRLTEGEFIYG
ncbi:MAG: sigma-70 family RNA polymerase sigma factor [Oscillospiraceae bacterium]|nr:sigma-70 family RNA polymerase sigma factor [Oscillospiraceae bacterium]